MAMDVAVQLRLMDALSGPARKAGQAMAALKKEIQAIDRAGRSGGLAALGRQYDALAAKAERAQQKMSALRGKALGAVVGAVGLSLPLKQAADYQLALARFAQISGWSDEERIAKTKELNKLLTEFARASRQSEAALAEGMTTIVNLSGSKIKFEEVVTAMRQIGVAASATGSDVNDLAKTFQSAFEHLKLPAKYTEQAFNVLHQAGKEGGFELKDMSRFFPSFLASYGILYGDYIKRSTAGMSPEQAEKWKADFALLKMSQIAGWAQVVRLGAGDATTAGTNMQNMLQKNMIDETAKHFEKYLGQDFRKGLWAHVNKGGDPIEWVASRLEQYVQKNKGNPLVIGQLFADKQAMEGYIPVLAKFMQEKGQLSEFFEKIRAARDAGVISRDKASTFATVSSAFEGMTNSFKSFWNNFLLLGAGDTLTTFFAFLADRIYELVQLMQKYEDVTHYVVRGVTGLITALGALAVFRYVWAAASLGLARAGMGAITLARAVPSLATALRAAGAAMAFFGRHAMFLGLIGSGGLLTYLYRNEILDWLPGFFDRLIKMFPKTSVSILGAIVAGIDGLRGAVPGLDRAVNSLANAFTNLWNAMKYLVTSEGDAGGFEKFRGNIADLGNQINQNFPSLTKLSQWFDDWQKQFGSDSFITRSIAYMEAAGVGLLGVMGFNFATMGGSKGLLVNLMILRSLVFVAGLAVGALSLLTSIAGIFLGPVIETLGDKLGWWLPGLLALAIVIGILAIRYKEFRNALSGFASGFWDAFTEASNALTEAWTSLMVAVFGEDEATPEKLKETFEAWRSFGRMIGTILTVPIKGLALAIKGLAWAINALKGVLPKNAFGEWVAFAATLAGVSAAIWGIRRGWMLLAAAFRASGGIRALGTLGGGAMALLGAFGLGAIGKAFASPLGKTLFKGLLLGGGPIGIALTFLGVLQLIVENLETIKKLWSEFLQALPKGGGPAWPGNPNAPPGGVEGDWMLPPQFQNWRGFSPLDRATEAAARSIEGAGSGLAAALQRVASSVQSAAAAITAASVPTLSVRSQAAGALSDAPPTSA